MLKGIIVDDEERIINGLKRHIDWDSLGISIIDSAINGKEGLEKVKLHNPDIVITDIKMPLMDGLKFIEKIKSEGYNPKVIVLTGHGEFDYAKESIKLGVVDYILKPFMPDEVYPIFQRAVDICIKEKEKEEQLQSLRKTLNESLPVLQEKFVEELMENTRIEEREIVEKGNFLGIDLKDKVFRVITLHIEGFKDFIQDNDEEYRQLVKLSILDKAHKYLEINNICVNFKKKNAHILIASDECMKDNEKFINGAMLRVIEECCNEFHISISIGVGDQVDNFKSIKDSFEQSLECLKYRIQFGEGKVIFYEDIIFTNLNVDILNLYNKEELVDALKSRDLLQIHKCTSEMFIRAKGQKYINIDYIKAAVMEMLGIVSLTLFQIGENKDVTKFLVDRLNEIGDKEDIGELEVWLKEFFTEVLNSIGGKTKQRCSRVVEQIIDVIKENYSKEISLEDISKIIYLTPNYLSNIFSNTMGESFTKYLSRYRIEKAKELLSSGKYKIYEVCEMVGYKNVDHFRKIFKEFTGKTPSEY
ncbi:response regulator [Clostridiaceae bacterium UIB06]|nr:response regulator [Clostridiaceae bacterium UIB06]